MLNGFCMQCGKARPVAIEEIVKTAADAEIPDLHIRCPECFSILRLRAVVPERAMEPWSGE